MVSTHDSFNSIWVWSTNSPAHFFLCLKKPHCSSQISGFWALDSLPLRASYYSLESSELVKKKKKNWNVNWSSLITSSSKHIYFLNLYIIFRVSMKECKIGVCWDGTLTVNILLTHTVKWKLWEIRIYLTTYTHKADLLIKFQVTQMFPKFHISRNLFYSSSGHKN